MRFALLALVVAGCAAEPASLPLPLPSQSLDQTVADRSGSHGMVVTGTPGQAFVSHIPMFQFPHDVQVVVAGSFDGDSLPASFSDRLFTFLPDRFSLDALRKGTQHELQGRLFLGNFEAGGRPLPGRFRFTTSRVVHEHVLDAGDPAAPQEPTALTYLLIGSKTEAFAIHRIDAAPSFDEIVRVRIGEGGPTEAALAAGVEAEVVGPAPGARLGLAKTPATLRTTGSFTVETLGELSCLEGPDFAGPCR